MQNHGDDVRAKCLESADKLLKLAEMVAACPTTDELVGPELDIIITLLREGTAAAALVLTCELREKIRD